MDKQIKINDSLDITSFSKQLREKRRLQIPNFFDENSAEYINHLLNNHKNWYLAYNEGDNFYESSAEQIAVLKPSQKQQFMNQIYYRAMSSFQYVFNQYYITQALELNENLGDPIHQVHHFVNSLSFLDTMRALTGEASIKKSDSYASQYLPGHFLTEHDDRHSTHKRVAAYVVSMNKVWKRDWGGHLAFYDDEGNIEEAFIPSFNTMNIFFVPQNHAVQMIAPFAGKPRQSILGWLHL